MLCSYYLSHNEVHHQRYLNILWGDGLGWLIMFLREERIGFVRDLSCRLSINTSIFIILLIRYYVKGFIRGMTYSIATMCFASPSWPCFRCTQGRCWGRPKYDIVDDYCPNNRTFEANTFLGIYLSWWILHKKYGSSHEYAESTKHVAVEARQHSETISIAQEDKLSEK